MFVDGLFLSIVGVRGNVGEVVVFVVGWVCVHVEDGVVIEGATSTGFGSWVVEIAEGGCLNCLSYIHCINFAYSHSLILSQ
jgi:hypothetical protein